MAKFYPFFGVLDNLKIEDAHKPKYDLKKKKRPGLANTLLHTPLYVIFSIQKVSIETFVWNEMFLFKVLFMLEVGL